MMVPVVADVVPSSLTDDPWGEVARAAQAAGIDFPTLCLRIVETAIRRRRGFPGIAAAML